MIAPLFKSTEICLQQKNTNLHIMKKLSTKLACVAILSILTCTTALSSCSNDDNDSAIEQAIGQGSLYKITVTLDNVNPDQDFVSVVVAGGTGTGKSDVWKVNGVAKVGESAIGLNKNDFAGTTKTYVLETTEPIIAFSGGVQIINSGSPIPLKYKIEKGNETIVNENLTLTGDGADFTKQYSF